MKYACILLPFLFILLLSGCAPTVFGVSKSTWQSLTAQQKQQAIKAYKERKRMKQNNADR